MGYLLTRVKGWRERAYGLFFLAWEGKVGNTMACGMRNRDAEEEKTRRRLLHVTCMARFSQSLCIIYLLALLHGYGNGSFVCWE
jgi:hypothetical protein